MAAHLHSLHLYPVKGLRGLTLAAAAVMRPGIDGDRRWLVVDADGRFLTQREIGAMARLDAVPTADGLLLRCGDRSQPVFRPAPGGPRREVVIWQNRLSAACADPGADGFLSDVLERPCHLVFMDDERARPVDPGRSEPGDHVGFADAFPLLAASLESLAALNDALSGVPAGPVPMARFRPNLVVAGLPAWSEDRWRRVRIGGMVFRAPAPCTRCVVITRDQVTGAIPEPGEPLRTLGRLNRHEDGIVFGANLIPEAPGHLAVGDAVEVLDG